MRKALNLFALAVVAVVLVAVHNGDIYARITGTNPTGASADIHCVGPDGAETCTDSSGNFIPTTDNDATLGTSSLRFSDVRAYDMTLADDLTVTDDATITDDLTVEGDAFLATGAADEVAIGADTTPDAGLEVVAGDNASVLIISSQNASTTLLSIASADGALVQEGGAILNEGGAAVDLRVEGDNTDNLLIVDGSADAVGIGSDSTPDATLEVTPRAADTYALRISSQNASTNLLAVQATNGEVELGVPLVPYSRTVAQIGAISPRAVGLLYLCSNCVNTYTLCVSTGTSANQFREVGTTGGCL